jgi:hypothetical protein
MPSRCAKSKGGKSFTKFAIVDKLPVDVDAKDWYSDGSEGSSDTSSVASVEGGNRFPVLLEAEMISESIGTFEYVGVTFSVSQPTWSDGVLVSPGLKGGVCNRVVEDLDVSEYFTEIAFCPYTGLPLPAPEDREPEFEATLGHGSLLPKHLYMGMARGQLMATIPSSSVSSSELDSACHILVSSNGGGSSSSDSASESLRESLFWKLLKDPCFFKYAKRHWDVVTPNCGAVSVEAMWMSSGKFTLLSSLLELPLSIFSISSFVFLTYS